MVRRVKRLLGKYEGLSVFPSTLGEKLGIVESPALRVREQQTPETHCPASLTKW